jgi:hypothetical protein
MEYLLITWPEDVIKKWMPVPTNNIMEKALFLSHKEKNFKGNGIIFSASRKWFE